MSNEVDELLTLTRDLLLAIDTRDWAAYEQLCDSQLSAFEPEANGHLIVGLPYHKFYFDLPKSAARRQSSISSPHVRICDGGTAVVSYTRLVQSLSSDGAVAESASSETRVWTKTAGGWKHVHFHRSPA